MAVMERETIVAISTPVGRGGIGVVRVSGPEARAVVEGMVRLGGPMEAGRARFGEVLEVGAVGGASEVTPRLPLVQPDMGQPGPRVLDQAVVTFWAGPRSYTGEDVVEVSLHGSPVLLEQVVRQCCAAGARLARPGEFTERAFLTGRIDLTQAEAVDDLIASSTLEQARLAARQMGGELVRVVGPVKARLVGLIAGLEAGIDFAEDDIDVMPAGEIERAIAEALGPLEALLASFAGGRLVRDGLRLAIVGRPNAGKSSLFNRLVERERAIVTAMPGTTRDTVSERVSLGGIPVELIDTAGLREAEDEAERLGIARSREAMAEADVVVVVVDALSGWSAEEQELVAGMAGRPVVVAWNKWDLVVRSAERGGGQEYGDSGAALQNDGSMGNARGGVGPMGRDGGGVEGGGALGSVRRVRTSAVTGDGVAELRGAIVEAVGAGGVGEPGVLTNLRQHRAVESAVAGLRSGLGAVGDGIPHEMVLVDLYEALRGLDALTGETTTEDVLRLVFSRFCIGK